MTRQELLETLEQQDRNQRAAWVRRLGYSCTVAARSGYPFQDFEGSLSHLVGFNEIQHKIYQYASHFEAGTDWGLEDYLNSLFRTAERYGIEGDFGRAVKLSLSSL